MPLPTKPVRMVRKKVLDKRTPMVYKEHNISQNH